MLKKVTAIIDNGGLEWQESKLAKWFNDKMEEPIMADGPVKHERVVYSTHAEDEALVRKLNREQPYKGFPIFNEAKDFWQKMKNSY